MAQLARERPQSPVLWMGVDLLAQSDQCHKLVMNDLTEIQFQAGTSSFWPGFGLGLLNTSTSVSGAKNDIDDRAYLQQGPMFKMLLDVLPKLALNRPDNPLLWIGRHLVTKTGRCRKIVLLNGRQHQCSSLHPRKFDQHSFKTRPQAIPYV